MFITEENPLEFLDIKIFRDAGKLHTSVYRKPTFGSPLILMMMSYKRNLISTLLHHSLMICSSSKALHNEILKLKKIF